MTEPSPTVYSYYAPQVEGVVRSAIHSLNDGWAGDSIHATLAQNVNPGLDDLHLPLMEKYERFARSEGVIGLEGFKNKYFTNGSSEGIFHLLSEAAGTRQLVYQLEGEYQGYQNFAEALRLPIKTVTEDEVATVPSGTFILSNPASKDGNIVDPELLATIGRRHHVIFDLAYMGMTQQPLNLDLTHPRILGVVGSLSKPFGLYYYRIGFCYTRSPIASLYGNKWFKNALSIKIGEAVLDHFNPVVLANFKAHYRGLQELALRDLNNDEGYNLDNLLAGHSLRKAHASDVWLLAHAPLRDWNPKELRPFKRGADERGNYRFCLTPYYMENE